jgi:hypothetical protein
MRNHSVQRRTMKHVPLRARLLRRTLGNRHLAPRQIPVVLLTLLRFQPIQDQPSGQRSRYREPGRRRLLRGPPRPVLFRVRRSCQKGQGSVRRASARSRGRWASPVPRSLRLLARRASRLRPMVSTDPLSASVARPATTASAGSRTVPPPLRFR